MVQLEHGLERKKIRLDELAKNLNSEAFTAIQLKLEKPRTVWVATIEVELSTMSESKTVAIVMKAATFSTATEVDYLITNATREKAIDEWVVTTYSQRNWVEVFYREALVLVRIKRVPSNTNFLKLCYRYSCQNKFPSRQRSNDFFSQFF